MAVVAKHLGFRSLVIGRGPRAALAPDDLWIDGKVGQVVNPTGSDLQHGHKDFMKDSVFDGYERFYGYFWGKSIFGAEI